MFKHFSYPWTKQYNSYFWSSYVVLVLEVNGRWFEVPKKIVNIRCKCYSFPYEALEQRWMWILAGTPKANFQQTRRNDHLCFHIPPVQFLLRNLTSSCPNPCTPSGFSHWLNDTCIPSAQGESSYAPTFDKFQKLKCAPDVLLSSLDRTLGTSSISKLHLYKMRCKNLLMSIFSKLFR